MEHFLLVWLGPRGMASRKKRKTRHERRTTSTSMGRTLDLSRSGVRFKVSTGLEEGDLLELEIGAGKELIHAEARVVHVELEEGTVNLALVEARSGVVEGRFGSDSGGTRLLSPDTEGAIS